MKVLKGILIIIHGIPLREPKYNKYAANTGVPKSPRSCRSQYPGFSLADSTQTYPDHDHNRFREFIPRLESGTVLRRTVLCVAHG